MVKKDDFNAFCSPPKLDDNIEEGLPIGHKGNSFKSGVNIPPFHRELDNDFRRMDNSARTLFRAVSYGTMISAFLDEATCEDDRIEGRKALINCFRSMADLSGRIMANSVLSRRKLFLKNVNFISKSTEKKLLKLPVFGSQLFNGKYFDTLHTSAENLRDARETQNVYNNTGSYSKNFNKSRDDRTPVNDFNRKRKGDYSENSESGAKFARTNTYSNKDNFRPGNFSRKGNFFRKAAGSPKGISSKNLVQTVNISPQKLLEKNVIEHVPVGQENLGYYDTVFVVPKRQGGLRPILNLKPHNQIVVPHHFKMETLRSIMKALKKGDYAVTLDLADAYFHIPIHTDYKQFLRFRFLGHSYQFRAMPFGLKSAPRVFTKIMAVLAAYLRK
ncbi:Hypothetical predicted protein [Mytilus galloprovincialis]|uniref:Reverse transcriptase domain-containing protein n=1 Tax=Mytilus galloprovincialis TaxID=29158 RepID=A0A8B6CWA3_MYTGA|nr:Hypothetical predicted protein [Mytilus galloprovincialis]